MRRLWHKIALTVSLLLAIGLAILSYTLWQQGILAFDLKEAYIYSVSEDYDLSANEAIAFVNVNVIPMTYETILANQTVLISDGIIQDITDNENISLPEGITVIDGTGQYLMPGLTDMHVHIEDANELLLFLNYGVTTVRNMWGNTGFKLRLNLANQLELRNRINQSELLGPTIYTTGPILEGTPRTTPLMMGLTSEEAARKEVRKQVQMGFDAIKVYDNLSESSYQAILDEAAQLNIAVIGHVPFEVGLAKVLNGSQHSIEHLTGYISPDTAELLIPEHELADYAKKTKKAGVWNCLTFSIWLKRIPSEDLLNQPELRYISPRIKRIWKSFAKIAIDSIEYSGTDYIAEMQQLMNQVVQALHKEGAGLLLGTDTDNAYLIPGLSLHDV